MYKTGEREEMKIELLKKDAFWKGWMCGVIVGTILLYVVIHIILWYFVK